MKTLIGIDWSREYHDIHVTNEAGATLAQFQIAHSTQGFEQFHSQIRSINPEPGDCLVAIESSHNQFVDYLWSRGYLIYVLAPTVVQGNRGRQSASGARTDASDAALLADILRTDRSRLLPWRPNSRPVRQIAAMLATVDDLTTSIGQYQNRLQDNLHRYFPQAIDTFSELTGQTSLHLLTAYPSPTAVKTLSYTQLAEFCRQQGYTRRQHLPGCLAHLRQSSPCTDQDTEQAYQSVTPVLADLLLKMTAQKSQLLAQVKALFLAHPDAPIFSSVPGAGKILAPKLLVMFGDWRDRYPSAAAIQTVAGTCPVTQRSGKRRIIRFRRACNHAYRQTTQQLAKSSVSQSTWAESYYATALARGLSKSHAYRCLANRWLAIIWTLWQRHEPYDEAYHWQHVQRYRRPEPSMSN
jgi:transposase